MMATTELCNTYPENDVWGRVSTHYKAAYSFGRRAIEEAWRCGDALIAAKAETKHGEWLPALSVAGIAQETAKGFMRLRRAYPEIAELRRFDSVSAALQLPQASKPQAAPPPLTIRNPKPLFKLFEILEQAEEWIPASLQFAWWMHPKGGNGIVLWTAAYGAVSAYSDALHRLSSESNQGDCDAVDDLYDAVIITSRCYLHQVRRLHRGEVDRAPPGGGA